MKALKISSGILFLGLYLFQVSCSSESIETRTESTDNNYTSAEFEIQEIDLSSFSLSESVNLPAKNSSCEITSFQNLLQKNFESLIQDPYFDVEMVFYLRDLHRKYVTHYIGPNYYGSDGQYNRLEVKRVRELQKFWQLDRQIYLNGQHTATLEDPQQLADMIESFDRSIRNATEARIKALQIIEAYQNSSQIPENTFFALNAFTRSNGLLVISDGILELLEESGIPGEIAFSGLLAHEWWHQAQFEYNLQWENDYTKNSELLLELEADFAAAYFLGHKRGATYNWKRLESFFDMSYNSGDCFTESPGHHGTPAQRLKAAQSGFELAFSEKKKGKPGKPSEIHKAFLESM
ncbi:hypothetical protein [Christiangramia sp. OXR-203]|uniref:hypothetical protein n=1 Tax=Christiangramia sp. OXR-203 TaxID=3100176 RepID=UPI002AC999F7|nr:hypothetical protein [Christiangramia sp. OXR-203]WPY99453.1 hypothetical protein T8I65_04430 [Christiangramia sp. OXR-203]